MDVADGQSASGWVFLGGARCAPWAGRDGPFFLHEAYQASDPHATTRLTVPVLWDQKLHCIVSNDSWNLVSMLASAFAPLGAPLLPTPLFPAADAAEIEQTHARLYDKLLNGVYKVGIGRLRGNPEGAAAAAEHVYATLAGLEETLATRRYLLGKHLTAVDLRLAMTLLRYDASYRCGFGLDGGRGGVLVGGAAGGAAGYPHVGAYVRDVYRLIAPTVDWAAFRQYYRWAPAVKPGEPLPDLERIIAAAKQPHGRETL